MDGNAVCPHCQMASLHVGGQPGARVRCPHCHGAITVGGGPSTAAAAGAPPIAGRRFAFACGRCASVLEADAGLSGTVGRCPTCGATMTIPGVDPRTGVAGPAAVADDGQLPTPMHAYAASGTAAPEIRRRDDGSQLIVCARCHAECPIDANICGRCGLPFTLEGADEVAAGIQSAPLARLALTCGVLALPTFCLPVLGVLAITFGMVALRRLPAGPARGRGAARAGLVLGGLSLVAAAWLYLA